MLSPDVTISGFSAEQWCALGRAFRATGPVGERPDAASGGIAAVTSAGRLLKLFSTRRGRKELSGHPWPMTLADLASRHQATWAVELSLGGLYRLSDRFAERLRRGDTYLAQVLELLVSLREVEAEGGLAVFPWPVADWPIPSERAVLRMLDALCPVGQVFVVGVFDRGDLTTCAAVRRGPRGIDRIAGPGDLKDFMGVLSGDFRRDYQFLNAAAERAVGPVALGCFAEVSTLQGLSVAAPGAWSAAVAARDVIVSPVTPGLALPLGLDVGRAIWSSLRERTEGLLGGSWTAAAGRLAPMLARGLPFFENDVRAWLGFDPLRLLAALLSAGRR